MSADIRIQLHQIQLHMSNNPQDLGAAEIETGICLQLDKALGLEASMARQKLRDKWDKQGDKNSKFYHANIKMRHSRASIFSINDLNGVKHETESGIQDAFLDYFKHQLGNTDTSIPLTGLLDRVDLPHLSTPQADDTIRAVTDEEIKEAIFSMNSSSTGGPDGFNAFFYKCCWDVISYDLCKAVQSFFRHNKMLRSINSTILTLIPKKDNPSNVTDFRPIACSNVIYKCISKILATRLKAILPTIIFKNQVAFLAGRNILDNVLLSHELLNGYDSRYVSPRMLMQLDIQKAYDTLHWDSIINIMYRMGFPSNFLAWIYSCISTPQYTISINSKQFGFFKGTRGIRQGDPMSSYLFIIVMEVFTCLLNKQIHNKLYQLHPKCNDPIISSLMYADDLLLFAKPSEMTIITILNILEIFRGITGLQINPSKSFIKIAGLTREMEQRLITISTLQPLGACCNYLGIPLTTSKITMTQCLPLYEKIVGKMRTWTNRFLTQAGRLTIIKSIIFAITVYWASTMILPNKLINMIKRAMRRFLWFGNVDSKKLTPVAFWKIQVPMSNGGLGIKNLNVWNQAAMSKHLSNLLERKDSLWVSWAWKHNIGIKNFWTMDVQPHSSWLWKSLLKLRRTVLPHLQYTVSPELDKLWYTPWACKGVLLVEELTYDQKLQSGIPDMAFTCSYIRNNASIFPPSTNPLITALWRKYNGVLLPRQHASKIIWDDSKVHSINNVYNALLRTCLPPKCKWRTRIWNASSPMKENFLLWKIFANGLFTLEKLHGFGLVNDTLCILCHNNAENLEHLFEECAFAKELWHHIMSRAEKTFARTNHSFWQTIYILTKRKTDEGIELLIILKKFASLLWAERNRRIFERKYNNMLQCKFLLSLSVSRGIRNSCHVFDSVLLERWAISDL